VVTGSVAASSEEDEDEARLQRRKAEMAEKRALDDVKYAVLLKVTSPTSRPI
jgi:hypothetical protein